LTTRGSEKGAEHGDYIRRLSPELSADSVFVEETGEYGEQRLNHDGGEAERFYRDLQQREIGVRVGMEATGYSRWFERLLLELDFELWIGDPAEIKARRLRQRGNSRRLPFVQQAHTRTVGTAKLQNTRVNIRTIDSPVYNLRCVTSW